jgi:hypothetical protein
LKAAQDLVASQNTRLGEYEQIDGQPTEKTLQYERALAANDIRLRQIEESLEYKLSVRLGKYPGLLRVLARIWRVISPR